MQNLLTTLKIEQQRYDDVYFGAYWRWCENVSINEAQTQMILANQSVNNWYNMEYSKCEFEFSLLLKNYKNADTDDIYYLYCQCTLDMFNRRCPILIKQAINNNIHNDNKTTTPSQN